MLALTNSIRVTSHLLVPLYLLTSPRIFSHAHDSPPPQLYKSSWVCIGLHLGCSATDSDESPAAVLWEAATIVLPEPVQIFTRGRANEVNVRRPG